MTYKKNELGNGHEMTIVRTFDAPHAAVWKAWTEPDLIREWWGPELFTNEVSSWDARQGGEIGLVMTAGQQEELGSFRGMRAPMGGRFQEVSEPDKLVFITTAIGDGGTVMLENLNTVTFREKDGKTEMTLHVVVQDVKPAMMEALKGMQTGWSQSFDKLEKLLAKA